MTTKRFADVQIKDAARGTVTAVFSTFNVVDKDGDYTLPTAIKNGTSVVISAYGHKSWEGALPVGKGTVRTTPTEAILEGQFFLATTAGRDTFEVVKSLSESGLGQWSYSLHNVISERQDIGGQVVNVLKSIDVHEVSPTLLGAGIDTRTLAAKAAGGIDLDDIERIRTAHIIREGVDALHRRGLL